MSQLIAHLTDSFTSTQSLTYRVEVWGREREDTLWEGWLVFIAPDGVVLRTGRETVQSKRKALAYWAGGLEPVYWEGALARAVRSDTAA
jgi:hypothetical protein